MALLTQDEITQKLESLQGWSQRGKEITRRVELADFVRAMGFVQSVALLAEKQDHHPDIDIRWNTVILTLSTHSEGGLTAKDFKLATEINKLPQ
jgi:4a-hydroxytetrahydrobiopterin dehydratase